MMQSLWHRLTRRSNERIPRISAPLQMCSGLAAAPVHEIRGPLLAYSLAESPDEEDIVYEPEPRSTARPVHQAVAALQEGEYEEIPDVPGGSMSDVRGVSPGRAGPVSLWWRRRLGVVGNAFRRCWEALTWPARAVSDLGGRWPPMRAAMFSKIRRFIAWEQWRVKRIVGARHHRMHWIGWASAMWGLLMSLFSTFVLVVWYTGELGNLIANPIGKWTLKIALLLTPVYVIVHLGVILSGVVLYRAYDERPIGSRASRRRENERQAQRRASSLRILRVSPRRRFLVSHRPRLQRISEEALSDASSSSSGPAMVSISLPETTLNVSESEAETEPEQESQSQSESQSQQQQPQTSSQPEPEPDSEPVHLQPHLPRIPAAELDSGGDADVESLESSGTDSPPPPPVSQNLLRPWLFTASSSYVIYGLGLVVMFAEGHPFVALFLFVTAVAAIFPTMDVLAEFYRIPEHPLPAEHSSESGEFFVNPAFAARRTAGAAELTPPPTYGQAMANLVRDAGDTTDTSGTSGTSQVNETSPLLPNN